MKKGNVGRGKRKDSEKSGGEIEIIEGKAGGKEKRERRGKKGTEKEKKESGRDRDEKER
jgi:hypothetical protein